MSNTDPQIIAGLVALAGALGYVGRVLIVSFTKNIERQQDLAEKQQSLMADQIIAQGKTLEKIYNQNVLHDERSVQGYKDTCGAMKEIAESLRAFNSNGVKPRKEKSDDTGQFNREGH